VSFLGDKILTYGGQAVIEGVMMRGQKHVAIAVRKPNSEIVLDHHRIDSIVNRFKFLKWPFIRGVVALVETFILGIKAMTWSASQALDEEDAETTNGEKSVGGKAELSNWEITGTILFAMVLAVLLFIVTPAGTARLLNSYLGNHLWSLNVIEGTVRMTVFFIYIVLISKMKDIQRVFQYHGAEHKTIHAYEAGEELTVTNVQKYTTLHPRCGTSFLLIVMVVSIFVFALLGKPTLWLRIIYKISLMPVVAGISFEFVKFTGRHCENSIIKVLMAPGLYLQKLTTREPDDAQVEVAIASINEVLRREELEP
jgi:uncharacterized protein YqhQ